MLGGSGSKKIIATTVALAIAGGVALKNLVSNENKEFIAADEVVLEEKTPHSSDSLYIKDNANFELVEQELRDKLSLCEAQDELVVAENEYNKLKLYEDIRSGEKPVDQLSEEDLSIITGILNIENGLYIDIPGEEDDIVFDGVENIKEIVAYRFFIENDDLYKEYIGSTSGFHGEIEYNTVKIDYQNAEVDKLEEELGVSYAQLARQLKNTKSKESSDLSAALSESNNLVIERKSFLNDILDGFENTDRASDVECTTISSHRVESILSLEDRMEQLNLYLDTMKTYTEIVASGASSISQDDMNAFINDGGIDVQDSKTGVVASLNDNGEAIIESFSYNGFDFEKLIYNYDTGELDIYEIDDKGAVDAEMLENVKRIYQNKDGYLNEEFSSTIEKINSMGDELLQRKGEREEWIDSLSKRNPASDYTR